jgi:hypothetical protein
MSYKCRACHENIDSEWHEECKSFAICNCDNTEEERLKDLHVGNFTYTVYFKYCVDCGFLIDVHQ